MSSPSLTGGSLFCDEIPRMSWGMTQGLGNSRIFVIASEAKQSLGILKSFLGILNLSLGILNFCSLLG